MILNPPAAGFLQKNKIYLGVFLISTSALMMELILTRIFSVKLYYHYAFMVISLALLGSGASGVYIYLFPNFFKRERLDKHLCFFSLGFAVSIPVVLWLILQLDFQLSFEPWMILRVFLLYSVPAFLFLEECVFPCHDLSQDIIRVYFFDLAGAGFGCLLVIPLLHWLGGPSAMLSLSLVVALACHLFASSLPGRIRRLPLVFLLLIAGVLTYEAHRPFLTIRHVKGRNEGPPFFPSGTPFSRITGVEINPITVNDVMRGAFKDFTGGLYNLPQVHIVVDDGRSFIRKEKKQYDIIQATLVDTWAATSAGAFVLTENNLYTVEAFKDYFLKLRSDGILTITRWNLDPPQQDLRLVSITRAAMAEMHLSNPERCMMIVRKSRDREAVEEFPVQKSGFADAEIDKIEAVSKQAGFEILYTPHTVPDNPFSRLITAPNPQAFYEGYAFDVAPTYDNSPFFFHTIRLKHLWHSLFLSWESKKTNVGMLVLFLVFFVSFFLVLLFIFVPLLLAQRSSLAHQGIRPSHLSYFVCLGLGFILIEMTLVQKFILFLGQPVYALSVVLFSILLFSGLGSFMSSRFLSSKLERNIRLVCLLISVLVLVYVVLLPAVLYPGVSLPTLYKAFIVVTLLFPLSFCMGVLYATGNPLA
jgi:hypothetical protein